MHGRSTKKTRKREFLDEMDRVVPWGALVQIVEPHAPRAKTGRPPFAIETMLRIHCLQQRFGLSDPAMEEALHDVPLYREFAGLGDGVSRLPDETTILRFRHLLEAHDLAVDMLRVVNDILQAKGLMLRTGTEVDATLISAPSSTKNAEGERDPEMHQVKKGNQWYFGMKAHIGVDACSGLVHTVVGTAANVSDINVAGALLASIRAKVEHPFRVIKQQFGFTKVRYRGLAKNTTQIVTLFALSNLWMARRRLIGLIDILLEKRRDKTAAKRFCMCSSRPAPA
jgi:IS5 family transposase